MKRILFVLIVGSVFLPTATWAQAGIGTGVVNAIMADKLQPLCDKWSAPGRKAAQQAATDSSYIPFFDPDAQCVQWCSGGSPDDAACSDCRKGVLADKAAVEGAIAKSRAIESSYTSLVCTDLLEGIPLGVLPKGTGCYPPEGGKWFKTTDEQGRITSFKEVGKGTLCFALLTPTGLAAFATYIAMIYKYVGWIIGVLAVLAVIISGLQMTIGAAAPDQTKQAQKRIAMIISGVVLYFLVGVILRTINPNFFT